MLVLCLVEEIRREDVLVINRSLVQAAEVDGRLVLLVESGMAQRVAMRLGGRCRVWSRHRNGAD